MYRLLMFFGFAFFSSLSSCASQPFFLDVTDTTTFPDGLPPGVRQSSVAWEDFNNDGLPDFLLTGDTGSVGVTKLYMQNSSGAFLDVTNTITFPDGLPPGVAFSSVAWNDFNKDGLPDFLLTGEASSLLGVTRLYMQNSTGVFLDVTNPITFPDGLPSGVQHSSVAWEDFNKDGLPDFLLTGNDGSGPVTKLYMQNSSGVFLDVTNPITFPDGLPPGVEYGSVAWNDFNKDGLPDFLLTGSDSSLLGVTRLYMQNSTGVFLDVTNPTTFPDGIPPIVYVSSVAWEDFNKDGFPDFLLTGHDSGSLEVVTKLYMQNSTGVFLDVTNTITFPDGLPSPVHASSVAWEDFNKDGFPDFLLTGSDGLVGGVTKLYMQNSSGEFLDVTTTNTFPDGLPPGVYVSSVAWEDFNNDGFPDFLLTGWTGSVGVTKLYMNGCPVGSVLNGTCIPCDGFRSSDHRECIVCPPNTYFNETETSCDPCGAGEIPNNDQTMCEPCPFGFTPSSNQTICEEFSCPFNCTPNGECYGTVGNQVCSCYSGFDGISCSENITQGNCPDNGTRFTSLPLELDYLPYLDPNETATTLVNGNLELTILSPLVLNRLATSIYFEDSLPGDTCSFPLGPYWNKILDSSNCLDTWELSLPWEVATSTCGFQHSNVGNYDIFEGTIVVSYEEKLDVGGTDVIRTVFNNFRIQVTFPSSISTTSGNVSISALVNVSLTGAIIHSSFDVDTAKAHVELLMVSQWPYSLNTSPSVVQTPSNISIDSIVESSSQCTSVGDSSCQQTFAMEIDPTTECFLNGEYILNFTTECRGTPSFCSFVPTQSATITFTLSSTDLCAEITFDVDASSTLETFQDFSRTLLTPQYQLGDTAYLRAMASVDDDAIDLINTTIKSASIDIITTGDSFQLVVDGVAQSGPPLPPGVNVQITPSGSPDTADFQVDMLFEPGTVLFSVELDLEFVGNTKRLQKRSLHTKTNAFAQVSIVGNNEEDHTETDGTEGESDSGGNSLNMFPFICWYITFITAAQGDKNFIRQVQRTTVDGKPYHARMSSMRYVFYLLLNHAFKKDLFIDNLPYEVTIPFLIYDDASSELTWPVYVSLLGFIAEPTIFKKTVPDKQVLRLIPWFFAIAPETKDISNQIDTYKSSELRAVVNHPFYMNGHNIIFKLRLLSARSLSSMEKLTK